MSPGLAIAASVVVACAALPSVACATGVPSTTAPPAGVQPATYAGMFGIPGEGMEYRISFRGMTVATVQVDVGRIQWLDAPPERGFIDDATKPRLPHHRAIAIASRGHTVGLLALLGEIDWKLATTLDLDVGRGVTSVEEATVVLAGERDHMKKDRRWGGGDVFDDVHSAAAKLRAWNPAKGERMRMLVHLDQAQLRVEAWLAGREVISAPVGAVGRHEDADRPGPGSWYGGHRSAPSGAMPAIRYEGIAAEKARFAVWISDDAARVPLQLRAETKWGPIAVDLVEYDPPADAR